MLADELLNVSMKICDEFPQAYYKKNGQKCSYTMGKIVDANNNVYGRGCVIGMAYERLGLNRPRVDIPIYLWLGIEDDHPLQALQTYQDRGLTLGDVAAVIRGV